MPGCRDLPDLRGARAKDRTTATGLLWEPGQRQRLTGAHHSQEFQPVLRTEMRYSVLSLVALFAEVP